MLNVFVLTTWTAVVLGQDRLFQGPCYSSVWRSQIRTTELTQPYKTWRDHVCIRPYICIVSDPHTLRIQSVMIMLFFFLSNVYVWNSGNDYALFLLGPISSLCLLRNSALMAPCRSHNFMGCKRIVPRKQSHGANFIELLSKKFA